jgi:hypothetical protein
LIFRAGRGSSASSVFDPFSHLVTVNGTFGPGAYMPELDSKKGWQVFFGQERDRSF